MKTIESSDLRIALARKDISCHFQPIVELSSGKIIALEARMRWEREAENTLSPADVLRLADAQACTPELDFAVLARATSDFADTPAKQVGTLSLAVNLNEQTLRDDQFLKRMASFLDESPVSPEGIRLELPFEYFIFDNVGARHVVTELSSWGFSIAVDHVADSSEIMTKLGSLPLKWVKIDQSLSDGLPDAHQACQTLGEIVSTCKAMDIQVGVEEIKRLEQLHGLVGAGCVEGQGMLICRPTPIGNLTFLLERGKCW